VRGCDSAAYPDGVSNWILTGDLANFRINVERGFDVIGFKGWRRNQALEFEPGDEVVFYVTGVQAFGAIARVRSEMFEDRTPIWPRGSKKRPEEYPWRVEAEPVAVLEESEFVPAVSLADRLEHVRKWPADHWQLAFQGQLRAISNADAKLLAGRIATAAGVAAAR
jgi:predicted RNA-binding protein